MVNQKADILSPFLKWAGGKRWLVQRYSQMLPRKFNSYIEPFLGGGAVFFHLNPAQGLLSDLNEELIGTYKSLQDAPRLVYECLHQYQSLGPDAYYQIRESQPLDSMERAARFIYLNHMCWNGLYRVNQQGKFNVPRGTKTIENFPSHDFEEISKAIQGYQFDVCDFEKSIEKAVEGDLIFADPPYTVRHNKNGFIKYNEKIFSWEDQERLSICLRKACERGVKVVSTNAYHDSVKMLYLGGEFKLHEVSRYSSISSKSSTRNKYKELLIISK